MTETANALKFQGNVTDIEGYFDIFAGLHFDLTLNNTYDGSQTILAERVHGEPDIDIRITIDGSDTPSSGASSFSMTKEAKQGFDADGQEDLSAINYIITAKASSSNLTASASNSASSSNSTNNLNLTASSSNLNDILNSTASNSNATHYFTSTTSNSTQKQSILDSKALISNSLQYDDDFDEETDEDDEIELFNDLFELWTFAPTKSRYENTHKESVFYSLEHVEDNPLYGKYITDQLHEDLELYAVRYSINGTDWEELQNWNDYLDEENRTFSYPIGEEIANSSEFKIQLYTKIKDTFWENYNGTEATFSNQAVLNDGDKPIARSNPAEPKLRSDIELTKEGLPQEVNGSIYRWDVTIDTDFSFNTNLYAVDLIRDADNTHSYRTPPASDYPITITENGSSPQILTVHVLTQDELDNSGLSADALTYETITVQTIQTLLDHNRYNSRNNAAYIYSYQDAGKTNQLLFVPLNNYLQTNTTLSYFTDVKIETNIGSHQIDISNEAKLLWNWNYGSGTGPWTDASYGSATIKKELSLKTDFVNKTAYEGSYDAQSELQTWSFDINQSGIAMNELTITDTISLQSQVWSEELTKSSGQIQLIPCDRKSGTELTERPRKIVSKQESDGNNSADWYTIQQNTNSTESTLKIHLANIPAGKYHKFTIQTKINDWNFANETVNLWNSASYEAIIAGRESITGTSQAVNILEHSLIKKQEIPYLYTTGNSSNYDYQNNTVQ